MPRDGAIIFRDIVGKLAILRIECDKCGRSGQYHVDRLIMRYGIDAKLFEWSDEITADCPRRHFGNLYDQCGARCPDLQRWSDVRLRSILSKTLPARPTMARMCQNQTHAPQQTAAPFSA